MEDAVGLVMYSSNNSSECCVKLGKYFNSVAQRHDLTREKLFGLVFDGALSQSGVESGAKLVVTVKYPEPRVTLLCSRKNPDEDFDTFKKNFVRKAVRFLTRDKCTKVHFEVILKIASEK